MNELIKFKFKGDRNYIQGGDIFDKVTSILNSNEYIEHLAFKSFTVCNCLLKNTINDGDKLIATIKTNKSQYVLVETTNKCNIKEPYDENALLLMSSIDGKFISMEFNDSFTTIENIIALTKKLNYSIEPDVKGKWVFGQLNLSSKMPVNLNRLVIESTRRILNKFSENKIVVDGVVIGYILFIVGNP